MTAKFLIRLALPALLLLSGLSMARAEAPVDHRTVEEMPKAPYLLVGAPTFEMTLVNFREKYNADNPTQQIGEFRAISDKSPNEMLTRAASKINENLYASTALEKGTGKIKTLQITYLPIQGAEEKAARTLAISYMANLMRQFEGTLSVEQSVAKVNALIEKGKGQQFYQQPLGAIRYVISDNGEKGLTFAVEPVKLALS
ncbi:DUF1454 family protein [Hafnia psychrotolerans]|jgi:hypothetical protein|uniref:DUF1454 family protein n=1 Tax=Hafnia psychrotolerans TaxID=1477018 RepID=A0ABQ1GUP4_9GAMM|nr:DUF1454 family protein [Hafnia psychrotolerans]GGA50365.1 hypothetical protein GCM10011328_27110 [Hafnia psychrotolerans]